MGADNDRQHIVKHLFDAIRLDLVKVDGRLNISNARGLKITGHGGGGPLTTKLRKNIPGVDMDVPNFECLLGLAVLISDRIPAPD